MFYEDIMVPLDRARLAEFALPYALAIAERGDGHVELISVYATESPHKGVRFGEADVTAWRAAAERSAREYLESLLQRLGERARERVTITLLAGDRVAEALMEHALTSRAGLIVMATHGHGPISRAWLGSVADTLVRSAAIPMLLVRPDEKSEANLTEDPACNHIIVPLDGSSRAEEVLDYAVPLGMLHNARFTLLAAVPPILAGAPMIVDPLALGPPMTPDPRLMESARRQAEASIAEVAERLRKRDLDVDAVTVIDSPAQAILHEAEARDVGLIAMSTRGRGGLERLLLGSVADKVIRASSRPILLHTARD